MLMGQVVGNIVSTRKHESLVGSKILEVKLLHENKDIDEFMIAIDCGVGAGIGAVSYTHLDVYKRQDVQHAAEWRLLYYSSSG